MAVYLRAVLECAVCGKQEDVRLEAGAHGLKPPEGTGWLLPTNATPDACHCPEHRGAYVPPKPPDPRDLFRAMGMSEEEIDKLMADIPEDER